jgi:hypothetical protein
MQHSFISKLSILFISISSSTFIHAQTTTAPLGGFDVLDQKLKDQLSEDLRPVQTAVPFLSITPNARAAGMGDQGVATSPDENSAYWNPGKLAKIDKDYGGSVSYNPWLRALVNDMSLSHLSAYYRLRKEDVVGFNFTYFDLGTIDFKDINGADIRQYRPQELMFSGTYSRLLSKKFSGGISLKYIYSNLSGDISNTANSQVSPGMTGAADIGFYYNTDLFALGKDMHLTIGAAISNIGGKISYGNNNRADFIPTTLRLGSVLTTHLDDFNKFNVGVEASKLMTPSQVFLYQYETDSTTGQKRLVNVINNTPNKTILAGMFGSFGDAPFGAREELQEIMLSFAAEYWYDNMFAVRGGYFTESQFKGNRQYFSLGLGIRYKTIGLDFAYLVPTTRNNPLANTLRFSLCFNFEKPKEKEVESVVE